MKTLKAVSLFSGCMGLDLGFEMAGIKTVVAVERDPACQKTIRANRPDLPLFSDVRDVEGDEIRKLVGAIDIIIGGPPCQSFSTMGRRGAMEDERGKALLEYLRLVKEIHPRFFVIENVKGILSSKVNEKMLVPWIEKQLGALGYCTTCWELNAVDFGVAQKRPRVFIVGSLDKPVERPMPCERMLTLRNVIAGLERRGLDECAHFGKKMASFMAKIPEGGNWRSLDSADRKKAMGGANLKSGGLTGCYRRLSFDRPSPTLLTAPTQRATTLCHPTELRPLSVLEYRRIQGIPDQWSIMGSTSQKYRQIGNAVPVRLGLAVARSIIAATQGAAGVTKKDEASVTYKGGLR